MELMQRLAFDGDECVDDYVRAVTKYKGSCDNVWLLTKYGYPSKSMHKQFAEFLSDFAQKCTISANISSVFTKCQAITVTSKTKRNKLWTKQT